MRLPEILGIAKNVTASNMGKAIIETCEVTAGELVKLPHIYSIITNFLKINKKRLSIHSHARCFPNELSLDFVCTQFLALVNSLLTPQGMC